MAGSDGPDKGHTMEETPTWAVAAVCFVLITISILIEHVLHLIGAWFKKKNKVALYEALEKIKSELMLLGFVSLLLIVLQAPISDICVSRSVGTSWLPCATEDVSKKGKYTDYCQKKGKVAFMSQDAIHQLHIFIFVLAVVHVLYCITTFCLGRAKMRKWKRWEDETKTTEYQYSNDPDRFRFAKNTTFGRRHLHFWSRSDVLLWTVCFFRQFYRSVAKVDYLTLRHGFIMAHLAPDSKTKFNFQKYISRSLDEDFKVVVGISPIIWFFSVLFLISNTNGWRAYLWLPVIPLIIILIVGAKLQVIITKMGLRIQDRSEVVMGTPVVQPNDDLFWFGRPGFILFLINFVLFQNAFQLAFLAWSAYEFKLKSCFHKRSEDVIIRMTVGVTIQVICSYVTLPLYALVTQMGTSMRPTVFSDRVATGLKHWYHSAKKLAKHGQHSNSPTPNSSRPSTPMHAGGSMSPVHLLHNFRQTADSPRFYGADADHWDPEGSPSSPHRYGGGDDHMRSYLGEQEMTARTQTQRSLQDAHHEISVSEFSFEKR